MNGFTLDFPSEIVRRCERYSCLNVCVVVVVVVVVVDHDYSVVVNLITVFATLVVGWIV